MFRAVVVLLLVATTAGTWGTSPPQASAQAPQLVPTQPTIPAKPPATGNEFRLRLMRRIGVSIGGVPLRDKLEDLSAVHGVAIFLDRRVDPGHPIVFNAAGPLLTLIEKMAEMSGAEACVLDSVVYVGPPEAVAKLRTLAAIRREDSRLSAAAKQKLATRKSSDWDNLTEPRQLLADLAQRENLTWYDLTRHIPHDLWPKMKLPPMTLSDRLTLLLSTFGLTWEISPDGRAIRPVPIPADLGLVRSYPGGSSPSDLARRYAQAAPEAQIKVVGNLVYVKARLEDHERLRNGGSTTASTGNRPGTGALTEMMGQASAVARRTRIDKLRVEHQPRKALLEHLAQNMNIQLRADWNAWTQAGLDPNERVSFEVKGVTADELFREIVKGMPIEIRYSGRTMELHLKP